MGECSGVESCERPIASGQGGNRLVEFLTGAQFTAITGDLTVFVKRMQWQAPASL